MLATPVPLNAEGARGLWARLTGTQRLALVGLAGVALILVAVFANMARTPEYEVAFSNLREEDAAAIVAKLKENKVPYEVGQQGTIRVPSGQAQEVRLLMASQGLPQKGSSTGMELFNQPQLGMTEFAEKINYQRALEGELSRTIGRLEAVESARVHVVMPQPSLFTTRQKDATASVVLQLKPGRRLDAGQVQSITQLVAGSVEGLKVENVAVMDTAGVVLSNRQGQNDPGRQMGNRVDVQRSLETRLESEVKAMLNQVVGPDKAMVRINADLDWDQYEANNETYSPGEKAPQIRSQRQISESQLGTNGASGGVPGATSNVPTYPGQQGTAGQNQAERRDTTTNYELSKTVEKLVRAPGGIKRLSVAVALDSTAIETPAQADAIGKLVATAAGLDVNRGDVVTLTTLPFSAPIERRPAQAAEEARQRELLLTVARLGAMGLGPLVVVALIWLILRRGRRSMQPSSVFLAPRANSEQVLPQQPASQRLPWPEEDPTEAQRRGELIEMAKSDPAVVAGLIRTWMHEDRR